jgi:rhomboid protease GluP
MQLVEVYRSSGLLACQHRAFVLHAVGIESHIEDRPDAFVLMTPTDRAAEAREQLDLYREESKPIPAPPPPPPTHAYAWITPFVYTAVLIAAGYFAGGGFFAFDWYEHGALTPRIQRSGEWWRILTALTLHVDHAHLIGNLLFGVLFSFMAARLLGSGVAWASIVASAAAGNLLDSILMPMTHTAVGASTAVFATLGLVSAYSWRMQMSVRMKWAHRLGPLIGGVVMLGLIGAGGENTDVLAHLTGFVCGVVLGVLYSRVHPRLFANTWLQCAAGAIATLAIAAAWYFAAATAATAG